MRNSLIILMAILILACSNNKLPKGVLTEKEITPVLVELHLAEAIYNQRYALEVSRDNYQEDLYLTILKKYKLDRKIFEASVLYYGKHPDKYKPVYDEVLNRLNEMSVKSRAKDSIDAKKPNVKAIVKDTVQIKKTDIKDSIPTKKPNVNAIVKDSLQTKKTGTKNRIKDSTQTRKIDAKAGIKDSTQVKK